MGGGGDPPPAAENDRPGAAMRPFSARFRAFWGRFGGAAMVEMLTWPEIGGVAEVMNMRGVIGGDPRMRRSSRWAWPLAS